MTVEQWIELSRHPSGRADGVHSIRALICRTTEAELRITFRIDGDIARIRLPTPVEPRIATQLWRHTCFEAFIAVEGRAAYHEFNLSPSGEWAIHAFSSYRDGGPLANEMMRPDIAVRSTNNRFELNGLIRLGSLSAIYPRAALRVGLSAVIETSDGLSYWALRHTAGKPDFHDADGFALLLERPRLGC